MDKSLSSNISFPFVHLDIMDKMEDILDKRRDSALVCVSSLENSVKFFQLTVKRFFVLEKLRPFSDLRNIFNLRHNLQRRLLHGCGVYRTADILTLPCPDVRTTPTNSHEILFPTWLRWGLIQHSTRPQSKVIGKREICSLIPTVIPNDSNNFSRSLSKSRI